MGDLGCQDVVGWLDQRAWGTTMALKALNSTTPPHPLLALAEAELAKLQPKLPMVSVETSLQLVPAGDWAKPVSTHAYSCDLSIVWLSCSL